MDIIWINTMGNCTFPDPQSQSIGASLEFIPLHSNFKIPAKPVRPVMFGVAGRETASMYTLDSGE